jgi:hypothetical protein
MTTTPTPTGPRAANLFDLEGGGISIHYSASSIAGRPLLSYRSGDQQLSFSGDEIRHAESEIGALITVTTQATPDLSTTTLTVLLPSVNVRGEPAEISAVAILTTHHTSIGGPALVTGALQSYCAVPLTGTASAVDF